MNAPRFVTARTVLRPLTREDLEVTHSLWVDPGVRRYLWDDEVIAEERAAEVIAASEAHFEAFGYGLWAVCDRTSGDLMGVCGFRPSATSEPELLFAFWPHYWGCGLANEAARTLVAYVFEILGGAAVVAATDVPNEASKRALERLGMRFERRGTLNGLDTVFYRIDREPAVVDTTA